MSHFYVFTPYILALKAELWTGRYLALVACARHSALQKTEGANDFVFL